MEAGAEHPLSHSLLLLPQSTKHSVTTGVQTVGRQHPVQDQV